MAQALPALADSAALTGLLNMDVNVQGSGNSLNSMLKSLTGAGQFELRSPSYADLNIEQMFCNAAALFGRSPQDRQDWPPGTQLEDLRGKFQLSQGNLEITEYSTATGNLNILGRGTIGLAKQNYSIKANARLDAETTSSNGCSVNKRLQNRQIPFVCKGTLDGSSANCKPDERVLKDLLKNTAFKEFSHQAVIWFAIGLATYFVTAAADKRQIAVAQTFVYRASRGAGSGAINSSIGGKAVAF